MKPFARISGKAMAGIRGENIVGDVFKLSGIMLKVVELPGHTTGSIGLIYEEENWLYAGDTRQEFVPMVRFVRIKSAIPISR
jgi:glyoxylase-like metal-dependent hydrolase (beta-lactamase superfamily II)